MDSRTRGLPRKVVIGEDTRDWLEGVAAHIVACKLPISPLLGFVRSKVVELALREMSASEASRTFKVSLGTINNWKRELEWKQD